MSGSTTQVLVAGAGPVGLATAVDLARRGVEVDVIDKVGPREDGESRALGVHARTLEVFDRLGVLPRVLAAGRPIHGFAYHVGGREVAALDVRGVDAPYPYILLLPQGVVERILLDRLRELGVAVRRPVELTGVAQDGDGVRVETTGGRTHADYLVAADGGRSTVRHLLGLDFPGRSFEGVVHLLDADLHLDGPPPAEHRGSFHAGRRTILGLGRLGGDTWRLIAHLRSDDPRATAEPLTAAAMQTVVDEHPHLRARVGEVHWGSVYRVSNRMVDRLRHGRVFLAGDAAHVHSPMGGQGLNTGVQDGHNLAWKLAARLDGSAGDERAGEALLDSYDAERLPVIGAVVRETAVGHRLLSRYGRGLAHPAAAAVLRAAAPALRRVLALPAVHDPLARAVSQVAVTYRTSPVVHDLAGARGPLRAGDRAPDATGLRDGAGRPTRLFAVLAADTAHHLLLLGGVDATDARLDALGGTVRGLQARFPGVVVHRVLVRAPGYAGVAAVPGDLHDVEVALHDRHRLDAGGVHLVRPDGHLAVRAASWSRDLERYLPAAGAVLRSRGTPARRSA
jgi:2-polyprenyl-6-methoxyphenol hydroxylase-like FAD-dependent oxidoreductase